MKEIKFRAWSLGSEKHNIKPQMVKGCNLFWNKGKFISGIWNNKETEIVEEIECIVMQYSGVNDNVGKELYEGDIFEAWFMGLPNNARAKQIVQFKDGVFHSGGLPLNLIDPISIKLLGNVYENPKLLDT